MADKSNDSIIKQLLNMNKTANDLIRDEARSLGMDDGSRSAELMSLHSKYNTAIKSGGQNVYKAKSAGQSTYGYVANSILGGNPVDGWGTGGFQMKTGNKKRDEWLNRAKLEKLFTTGDSQMMSYFMSTNSDIVHMYDEIDSVCAYFYQLEEAIRCIRDNVLTAEAVSEAISYNIVFPSTVSSEEQAEYAEMVKDAFTYQQFDQKLIEHITPKGIKYGKYYTMTIPFSDTGWRLYQLTGGVRNSGLLNGATRATFESANDNTTTRLIGDDNTQTFDELSKNITSLFESVYADDETHKMGEYEQHRLQNVQENLKQIYVCEDSTPPNIADNIAFNSLSRMDKDVQELIDKALAERLKKEQSKIKRSGKSNNPTDMIINDTQMDEIAGCYIKLVDPRQMYPIKIFDFTLGYYYFEGYDYAKEGATLTDMLSNDANFNNHAMILDNIVNSVLKNLKYSDLIKGDQQLRSMVLNCVLYAERRDAPVRVKFVPVDYVTAFETNVDEYGNGQPVLMRSLFYARLYTSLLLFNITAIITKSTDSEYYYLRDSALDPQYSNMVTDLMDQLQDANVDPIQIANGNILHGNRAINKRFYVPVGTSDVRPFDMETVSGQSIDIHNDFMTDLRKMAIGSTGEPAVMVDFMDEVEYATMLGMANIKSLKRCNTIGTDFNPAITRQIQLILKYNNSAIPANIRDNMKIELKKSKAINNNITNQQLTDAQSSAQTMATLWVMGNDSAQSDLGPYIIEELTKAITIDLTSSAPWGLLATEYDKAVIRAKARKLQVESQQGNE